MSKDATGIRSQHTKIEMLERETFLLKLQLSYYQDARRIDVSSKRVMEMQVGVLIHSTVIMCDVENICCAFRTQFVSDSKRCTKK